MVDYILNKVSYIIQSTQLVGKNNNVLSIFNSIIRIKKLDFKQKSKI